MPKIAEIVECKAQSIATIFSWIGAEDKSLADVKIIADESIGDIRGEGLLLGVELVTDRETRQPFHQLGSVTTERCFELGLSMNIRRRPERGAVWRIAPPLTVTTDEIDLAITILDQALVEGLETLTSKCINLQNQDPNAE
jgi:adenosylmethionine-8-amino-7-oxononanoate aminotransferase